MPKLPKQCPACNTSLIITRLTCPACGTEVTGSFPPDLFSRLAPNDFDFVVLFVKSKGNIKEMERELGISYWTIRTRLGEIVAQLGLEGLEPGASPPPSAPPSAPAPTSAEPEVPAANAAPSTAASAGANASANSALPTSESSSRRQAILEQLNAGLLSVSEAAARLEELKKQDRRSR